MRRLPPQPPQPQRPLTPRAALLSARSPLPALLLLASCGDPSPPAQTAGGAEPSAGVTAGNTAGNTAGAAVSAEAPGLRALLDSYLTPSCAQEACHGGERGIAGLRLVEAEEARAALVGAAPTNANAAERGLLRVTPGDVERSYLWQKLTLSQQALAEEGLGAAMPISGRAPGARTLDAVRAWIEAGAPLDGAPLSADDLDEGGARVEDAYVQCAVDASVTETRAREEAFESCFAPPEDAARDRRLYTPVITIPPRSEQLICSYLSAPIDAPMWVNKTVGQQMTGGHHAAVFLAVSPSDEPPHECRDDEMSNFRFAAGAGGGGGQDTDLPDGVALKIEPGQQFVIQSHYINSTDAPMEVMDAVDLVEVDEGQVRERVDPFAIIYSELDIPAGAEGFEVRKLCRLEEPINIYMLLGHTHDAGVLFEFIHHAGGLDADLPRTLYRAIDGPLLRDNPEIKYFDPPIPFAADDVLEVVCRWDNPSDEALGWPNEMCVALMYYGPGAGWMTCDTHDEVPSVAGGGEGEGCVPPDAPGNALGVGRACTASGGECASAERARLCLATFDARANFCSFLSCAADEECGEGAVCLAQGPATACVPVMCAE